MQGYIAQAAASTPRSNLLRRPAVYVPDAYRRPALMTSDRFRPDTFLPLTPVAFEILLALADGEQHGYRIMQDVNARAGSAVQLHAGTLYRALARLLEQALIEELEARPTGADDERRRYYCLTGRGRAVAIAEAGRLAAQLATARARLAPAKP